jgi:hypothetical protein
MVKDDVDLGVDIIYEPGGRMTLSGLQPELPPRVRFVTDLVEVWSEEHDWLSVAPDLGLLAFRLFDPRAFEPLTSWAGQAPLPFTGGEIHLYYRIGDVIPEFRALGEVPPVYETQTKYGAVPRTVPPELQEWIWELVHEPREVVFRLGGLRIAEILHQDISSPTDRFVLRFAP